MLRTGLLAATVMISAAAAQAQAQTQAQAQDRAAEIDRIFSWTKPAEPGCVVAVAEKGKPAVTRAYGSADLERGTPIGPHTVFDAGSVQKQFVAAAVLMLAEEGRLSLSDDVRKHVPELPDYGRKLTIDHLLTHTSGLRDWTALLPLSSEDEEALTAIRRQRGLNFAPGDEWAYSNSGYVLLKEIVARVSGMSFTEFTTRRLFEPLGMTNTVYSADMLGAVKNRAMAYEKEDGRWSLAMRTGKARGGGGLLSTASDLLIWNEALASGRLGPAVTRRLQEPAKLNNGRRLQYARGLIMGSYKGVPEVWHSGGAAGYSTWLGRYPEQGLSIAFMCNVDVNGNQLAHQIADRFLPAAALQAVQPPTPDPAVAARAGLYLSEAGEPLRLLSRDGRLGVAGGPPLMPAGADRFRPPRGDLFFRSQDEFELRWVSPDEVELKSMEGASTRYRRAAPFAPSAAALGSVSGRYASGELASVVLVAPEKEGLALRLAHQPDQALQFAPVAPDLFQRGQMMLRFHRDAAGKVTGLDYSNPLLRSVRFTRQGGE